MRPAYQAGFLQKKCKSGLGGWRYFPRGKIGRKRITEAVIDDSSAPTERRDCGMPLGTSSSISAVTEDERSGPSADLCRPGNVETAAADDLQASERVQRLLCSIETLAKGDPLSQIPTERLAEVDQIQEHLLEHLDELNQLLQWQVERLFRQGAGPVATATIA